MAFSSVRFFFLSRRDGTFYFKNILLQIIKSYGIIIVIRNYKELEYNTRLKSIRKKGTVYYICNTKE